MSSSPPVSVVFVKNRRFSFLVIPIMVLVVNTHGAVTLTALFTLAVALVTGIWRARSPRLRPSSTMAICLVAITNLLAPLSCWPKHRLRPMPRCPDQEHGFRPLRLPAIRQLRFLALARKQLCLLLLAGPRTPVPSCRSITPCGWGSGLAVSGLFDLLSLFQAKPGLRMQAASTDASVPVRAFLAGSPLVPFLL